MQKDSILWLKFEGRELDLRSIPIYELGDTLISLQRIVHKTYLYKQEKLKKGAHLTMKERQHLSLQVSDRKKSSDAYALTPFLTDPAIVNHISDLLRLGLLELGKYQLKRVLEGSKKSPQVTGTNKIEQASGSVLAGAIYAETVNIHNHINNIGQVERISLIPSSALDIPKVTFDTSSQAYVRSIANESIFGDPPTNRGLHYPTLS